LSTARYAIRRLLLSPGFTCAALLTLGLAIGANTAVFSVVNSILLKPLPFREPERLASLSLTAPGAHIEDLNMSSALYFTFLEQGRAFENVGLYRTGTVSLTHLGPPDEIRAFWTTSEILPILGVSSAAGRLFTAADATEGNAKKAILTWGFSQLHFTGENPVGRHITLDGADYEIIGALPGSFRFVDPQPSVILPLQYSRANAMLGNFNAHGLARLRPGVTFAQANADVARMLPLWLHGFPAPAGYSPKMYEDARIAPRIHPFSQDIVGNVGESLWVVMGTIGAVLLIACLNVANLLMVRAEGRSHELAVRAALGAGWSAIAKELVCESMALSLAGGVLGLALAFAGLKLLVALAPAGLPRLSEIGLDPRGLLFTFGVSVAAGLLFGLFPVFRYASPHASTALREGNRNIGGGRTRHRTRNILVVAQVGLALLLLIGSGLMIRTFQALRNVDPGFTHPENILTIGLYIPESEGKERDRVLNMERDILAKLAALPGVESTGLVSAVTMSGGASYDLLFAEDHPLPPGKLPPVRRYKFISTGFFSTVGRRFAAGRDITWNDVASARPVAIVSEAMARDFWGSASGAVGKHIRASAKDGWREVIGVAADERDDGVQEKAPAIVYWPFAMDGFWGNRQYVQRSNYYMIRSPRAASASLLGEAGKAIWSVAPDSPLATVRTLDEIYNKSMARTSFTLTMLAIAGGMALVLGLVGIYGVVAYSVQQRRREIGIRMALGAKETQVSGLFLRQGLILATIGIACGLAVAAWLRKAIESLLFGVSATDPWTYALTSMVLMAAAVLASYLPARRAAAVDPIETLRSE
jgi:predicted permease